MSRPKIKFLWPDNDDIVTGMHPDGAYLRQHRKCFGWIQIVVVGPMPYQPIEYVDEAGTILRDSFEIANISAMPLFEDDPGRKRLMMQRGFWCILARNAGAADIDISAFETPK